MNRDEIKAAALSCGFKLKEQADGSLDLNEYVYEFADVLLDSRNAHTSSETDSNLQPHQQRVVEEKTELDNKLISLGDFCNTPIFAGLDQAEQERLNRQFLIMLLYAQVLKESIADFPVKAQSEPSSPAA